VSEPSEPSSEPESEAGPKRPPTPGPYLLTIILFGAALWFGYDGWLNPGIEAKTFNRILAPVLLVAAIWDGYGTRRRIARRAAAASEEGA
jgi:hypothetical protein